MKIWKEWKINCFAVRLEWVKTLRGRTSRSYWFWSYLRIPHLNKKVYLRFLRLFRLGPTRSRAGHFPYFFIFSIIKKDSVGFFMNLFLHQSYFKMPTPSQRRLIKNAKNHFLLLKKLKNTESAQLWVPTLKQWIRDGLGPGKDCLKNRAQLCYLLHSVNIYIIGKKIKCICFLA